MPGLTKLKFAKKLLKKATDSISKSKGFLVDIQFNKEGYSQLHEIPTPMQLDARNKWIKQYLVLHDMEYARKQVIHEIPNDLKFRKYKKSIKVIATKQGYGVGILTDAGKDQKVDSKKDVIYVMPVKSRVVPTSKRVKILYENNPWTSDTLPFTPNQKEASLVIQPSSKKAVDLVRKQKLKTQRKWRAQLKRIGEKTGDLQKPKESQSNDSSASILRGETEVDPLYITAVTLELGTAGQRPTPHWGPAYHKMIHYHAKQAKKPIVAAALFEYGWKEWTVPLKNVKHKMPLQAYIATYKFRRAIGIG